MLELDANDHTVRADQPLEVFTASRSSGEEVSYQLLAPTEFIAFLRPEDVLEAYLSQEGAPTSGAQTGIDIRAVKDQAVQGLYHRRSAEYDVEKHGRYALTLVVENRLETYKGYEIASTANQLTLSIGSEEGMVCLHHRKLADSNDDLYQFIYSPELYRTIRELF